MIAHLVCMYNGLMKKRFSTWFAPVLTIAFSLALAVALGACVPQGGTSAGAAAPAHAESSAVSASSQLASSSDSSSSAVEDAEDDSYASSNSTGSDYVAPNIQVKESGEYTDKDSVALYIHLYGHLPSNYITKTKARKAGWVSSEGNLWEVLPGKSIGGGPFYNDEGLLPDAPGREWTECDIDYQGGFRNATRIVFSNDGLVYYTDDHYKTFQQIY